MRQLKRGLTIAAALTVLALAACSSPAFDPVGTFVGTVSFGTGTITVTIAQPSSGVYAFTLDDGVSPTANGACTHDAGRNANDLTCTYVVSTVAGTLTGTVEGSTFSGTWTIVNASTVLQNGTFRFTKQ